MLSSPQRGVNRVAVAALRRLIFGHRFSQGRGSRRRSLARKIFRKFPIGGRPLPVCPPPLPCSKIHLRFRLPLFLPLDRRVSLDFASALRRLSTQGSPRLGVDGRNPTATSQVRRLRGGRQTLEPAGGARRGGRPSRGQRGRTREGKSLGGDGRGRATEKGREDRNGERFFRGARKTLSARAAPRNEGERETVQEWRAGDVGRRNEKETEGCEWMKRERQESGGGESQPGRAREIFEEFRRGGRDAADVREGGGDSAETQVDTGTRGTDGERG